MAYCGRCDRYFVSEHALWQHESNSSMHWLCRTCDRDFSSSSALFQHFSNSPRHHFCMTCDIDFVAEEDLQSHYVERHFYCRSCSTFFSTANDLKLHKSNVHFYCEPCNRYFRSKNNLEQHLGSSVHQPKRYKCPGRGCNNAYVSASALILHCEAGTCPSGVTRRAVDTFITSLDRGRAFTNPDRLITGPDGSFSPPSSSITTVDLSRCWNGRAYECILCGHQFRLSSGLKLHLQSPAHAEKIYRCSRQAPVSGCGKEFKTFSALVSHIERGDCGAKRFRQEIEGTLVSLGNSMKRLTG